MFTRKLVSGIALSALTFVSAASYAAPSTPPAAVRQAKQPCEFNEYRITSVSPYRVQQNMGGRIVVQRTTGAEIFVEAQPGLTAEWLWLNLSRQAAVMQGQHSMKDCVLDIDKLRVDVTSAGPGFRVRLVAPDEKTGQEVLRRAQLLVS